jgi:hypothetical protein
MSVSPWRETLRWIARTPPAPPIYDELVRETRSSFISPPCGIAINTEFSFVNHTHCARDLTSINNTRIDDDEHLVDPLSSLSRVFFNKRIPLGNELTKHKQRMLTFCRKIWWTWQQSSIRVLPSHTQISWEIDGPLGWGISSAVSCKHFSFDTKPAWRSDKERKKMSRAFKRKPYLISMGSAVRFQHDIMMSL